MYIENGILYQMFGNNITEIAGEIDMISLGMNGIADYMEQCRDSIILQMQEEFVFIEEDINL